MRFPYQEYLSTPSPADRSEVVHQPVVPIRVIGLHRSAQLVGLLDTGAVETILPEFLMSEVGVASRPDDLGVILGFDGTPSLVQYGTIVLEVDIKDRPLRWHAKVAFHSGRKEALLGHLGFLQFFAATFNGPERHVTLRPKGTFPRRLMAID